MATKVKSNMVSVSLRDGQELTLEEFLSRDKEVPVRIFGDDITSASVTEAVEHVMELGGGTINVPITDTYNALKIFVERDKYGVLKTRFEYNDYKAPTTGRPYLGGAWEVGDIVKNLDMSASSSKCFMWICIGKGIPGVWSPYKSQTVRYNKSTGSLEFGYVEDGSWYTGGAISETLDGSIEINDIVDLTNFVNTIRDELDTYYDTNSSLVNNEINRATAADEQHSTQISVLSSRMDSFARLPDTSVSTTADAELVDIRVKADGTTASTAGNAVREQVTELKNELDADPDWQIGFRVNNNGALEGLTENANYRSYIIKVYQGEVYKIYGKGTYAARLWSTHLEDGTTVRIAESSVDASQTPVELTIGNTEKYLCFNSSNNYNPHIYYYGGKSFYQNTRKYAEQIDQDKNTLSGRVDILIGAIDGGDLELVPVNIFDGNFPQTGYIDNDGADAASSVFKRTDYIPIDSFPELYFLRTYQPYQLEVFFL